MKSIIKESIVLSSLKSLLVARLNTENKDTVTKQLGSKKTFFNEAEAIIYLQRMFRKYRFLKESRKNTYDTYMALTDKNEKYYPLSKMMFGRHQAEIQKRADGRVENPYIPLESFYHRDDTLTGPLYDALLRAFNIPSPSFLSTWLNHHEYVPIPLLNNTSVHDIIETHSPECAGKYTFITKPNKTIALLKIKKSVKSDRLKEILRAAGMIASPWDISINVKDNIKIPVDNQKEAKWLLSCKKLQLPYSLDSLMKSAIVKKITAIAKNVNHDTNLLAEAIIALLSKKPRLSHQAISRISLILDTTFSFQENNYESVAWAVYCIVHEISLSLLSQTDTEMNFDYQTYIASSRKTLYEALDISDISLANQQFFLTPSVSGTNAFSIALELAKKAQLPNKKAPLFKIILPIYYEFIYLNTEKSNDSPDIFILSTGPIMMRKGVCPGVDINYFIQKNIIETKRTTPATLLIDATSSLYQNLHLSVEAKNLVESGDLSIIIHESHQKFGLLHTDQAQCGRTFGIVSKKSYASSIVKSITQNGTADFKQHLDMRVHAYIINTCRLQLEKIKHSHFENGNHMRTILKTSVLKEEQLYFKEDSQLDKTENYFISAPFDKNMDAKKALTNILMARDSFGHFRSSYSLIGRQTIRVSAGSGRITNILLESSRIYLRYHFEDSDRILDVFKDLITNEDELSLSEQIITLSMLRHCSALFDRKPLLLLHEHVAFFINLKLLLEQCKQLRGLPDYKIVCSRYMEFRKALAHSIFPCHINRFVKACHILMTNQITLTDNVFAYMKHRSKSPLFFSKPFTTALKKSSPLTDGQRCTNSLC